MTTTSTHAIVIGGSMAGLLSARVLSTHFDRVTVIERDVLPETAEHRAGVPQGRHLHTLLVSGQRIIERLFPGFTEDMRAYGARDIHWGRNTHFVSTGGYNKQFDSGIHSNSFARVSLEWLVRQKVAALPNVTFLTGTEVEGLLADNAQTIVTGVRVVARQDKTRDEMLADLVVDASGRTSKAPEWLTELGYDAPEESLVKAHMGYATRWFKRPANPTFKGVSYFIQGNPAKGNYRSGGLMQVEDDQWVVTLIGGNADYPPTDEDGFMAFAASLATPALYEAIRDAEPISTIYGYRRLENRIRHYERLPRRPAHFIVTGDAACAFNPVYGQGMTAAAMEAEALDQLLTRLNVRGDLARLGRLPALFQKRIFQLAQGPWLMNTSEDARYPLVEGMERSLVTRLTHKYFDLVALAMPHDSKIALRFIEALNLMKSPSALLWPDVLARVLWHVITKRGRGFVNAEESADDVRLTGEFASA